MDSFNIEKNFEFGRFAVASNNIEAGQLLFEEYPFAYGPKCNTKCICLECFKFINGDCSGDRCQTCSWPLCEDCAKLSELKCHRAECKIFKSNKCKFYNTLDPLSICIQLDCITPLRVLLAKEEKPNKWNSEIDQMEHHKMDRQDSELWAADANNIVEYLLGPCQLKSRGIDGELIQKVIGILEINAFEAKTCNGHEIRCLFPKLAICSHSCISNTNHAIHSSEGYKMQCRATIPILKGNQLYTSYTYTLNGTAERQKHLRAGKYFTCHCERCLDPTELGTDFSTLKCLQCGNGNLLASDPLDFAAYWKCLNCSSKTSSTEVLKILETINQQVNIVYDSNIMTREKIEQFESCLLKFKSILHPNHYIFVSIRSTLIDLMQVDGSNSEHANFGRINELCRNVLEVLNTIEPGKSRARGKMLLALHNSITALTKTDNKLILSNEASDILKEATEILSWEDFHEIQKY